MPKKKPKKPAALITDLVMKGQIARSQCAPLKGARAAAADAKKKKKGPEVGAREAVGQRQGQVPHGGKYSSATVRGTIWLVRGSLRRDADQGHARDGQVRDIGARRR